MDKALEYLNMALQWVNMPVVKTVLALVGGWAWKNHPATVNRAYPFVALVASALLALSQTLSSLAESFGAQPAAYHAAAAPVDTIIGVAASVVLPVLTAVGIHSWWKNVIQWIADGANLVKK